MTIQEFLVQAAERLHGVSTLPMLDAEILLCHIMQRPRSFLITHAHEPLSIHDEQHCNNLVARRATGVPIAYLTHTKEFYSREFMVDERVLVPRPETEMIVDAVLAQTNARAGAQRILDIGTGSGVLAITLALEITDSTVVACDIDPQALEVAKENATTLGAEVSFYSGDLYAALPEDSQQQFDIIVSNPPYVNPDEVNEESLQSNSLRYEPQHALYSPDSPIATIQRIIANAPAHLRDGGSVFIEIGYDQGARALEMAHEFFPDYTCTISADLGGKDRMLSIVPN